MDTCGPHAFMHLFYMVMESLLHTFSIHTSSCPSCLQNLLNRYYPLHPPRGSVKLTDYSFTHKPGLLLKGQLKIQESYQHKAWSPFAGPDLNINNQAKVQFQSYSSTYSQMKIAQLFTKAPSSGQRLCRFFLSLRLGRCVCLLRVAKE